MRVEHADAVVVLHVLDDEVRQEGAFAHPLLANDVQPREPIAVGHHDGPTGAKVPAQVGARGDGLLDGDGLRHHRRQSHRPALAFVEPCQPFGSFRLGPWLRAFFERWSDWCLWRWCWWQSQRPAFPFPQLRQPLTSIGLAVGLVRHSVYPR